MGIFTKRSSLVAAVLLMVAGSAGAATIEVEVPFPFTVHGRTMPAGRYLVRTVELGSPAVEIRGEQATNGAAFILTEPVESQDPAGEKPALTFTRHETSYELTGIWYSGGYGRAVNAF